MCSWQCKREQKFSALVQIFWLSGKLGKEALKQTDLYKYVRTYMSCQLLSSGRVVQFFMLL